MKQGVRWGVRGVTGWAVLALLAGCGEDASTSGQEVGPGCRDAMELGTGMLACGLAADAYAEEALPQTNYGVSHKLVADNLNRRAAFLRFEVPTLPAPVLRATLRLYAMDGSTDGPKLYPASTDWSEDSLTWEHSPVLTGAPLGDVDAVPNHSWVEYDVTAAVKGSGVYGFALVTESRNGVDFASKDHARKEWAPRLILTLEDARQK
ncbi:DNRLRE domain-containing protein [Archangium gephyra]|uniref:CBM96 family carbohydrate-binding protein n=1 Tax=Archangium gephyra TaxID=48 RepID=UPI0035D41C09